MDVAQHFDSIAEEYDFWKRKNAYYHSGLKSLFDSLIKAKKSIIEIGCGTGDILASLNPDIGLGIDISPKMIERARQKHKENQNLNFISTSIYKIDTLVPYHHIILADVIEHLEEREKFFKSLHNLVSRDSKILLSMANPIWEPVLELAEKFKMKMPEGPHFRISTKDTEKLFNASGFKIEKSGYKLLMPIATPFSDLVNKYLGNIPLLKNLSFVVWWQISKI